MNCSSFINDWSLSWFNELFEWSTDLNDTRMKKDFYPNPDEYVDWDHIEKALAEQREKSRMYIKMIKKKLEKEVLK